MTIETEARVIARGIRQDSYFSWYVVFLLTFAYTVAFIDRQVLNLLVDPIKQDLLLTDVQISLLQGLAFMAAYVVFGPVFGRWVDNGNRRNVLVFGVALWSGFTVLCGLCTEYWQLFLARAGVGAAEACLAPAGWSLIADYFTRKRLPRAMSIFMLGPSLGAGLALVAGGVVIASVAGLSAWWPALASLSVWQLTFVIVGLPGLLLAALLLTVREPERVAINARGDDDKAFTLREVLGFLWERRAFYVPFFVGMSLLAIVVYGFPTWLPAFLIRHYHADASVVGVQYGAQVLIVGAIGIYSGPWMQRWLLRRGYEDATVRCAWLCTLVVMIGCAVFPLTHTFGTTLMVAGVINLFYALPQAVAASALQIATPNRLRGVVVSVYYFLISVFGLGIAPSIIAFVTDKVFRDPARVGQSLALVCFVSALLAVWLLRRALVQYRQIVVEQQDS